MVSEQINQGTPWETISVNLVIDGPQCSPTSQAEEYSLERALNGLVCRDRGTPVLTLWGTHDQGQPTTPLEPTLSLTGKAIQAKPGSPENAAIPGIDEMYRPRKPKPWPRYQLAPMASPLIHTVSLLSSKIYCTLLCRTKTKQKRVGRTKSLGGFRNLSAAQKKFRKVDRKSSCYFIHSKFARSETASYTTSTTCGCTIPVWWNSVKPPVTHWLKGDLDYISQTFKVASTIQNRD